LPVEKAMPLAARPQHGHLNCSVSYTIRLPDMLSLCTNPVQNQI